jgi:hypothetical protein
LYLYWRTADLYEGTRGLTPTGHHTFRGIAVKKLFALLMVFSLAAIGCEDKKSSEKKPGDSTSSKPSDKTVPSTDKTTTPADKTTAPADKTTKPADKTTDEKKTTKKEDGPKLKETDK